MDHHPVGEKRTGDSIQPIPFHPAEQKEKGPSHWLCIINANWHGKKLFLNNK